MCVCVCDGAEWDRDFVREVRAVVYGEAGWFAGLLIGFYNLLNSKKQNTYRKNPSHRAILSVPVSLVSPSVPVLPSLEDRHRHVIAHKAGEHIT